MPFRIEDEARRKGANFVTAAPFRPYAMPDGSLITGQQQNSRRRTAELVIEALGAYYRERRSARRAGNDEAE